MLVAKVWILLFLLVCTGVATAGAQTKLFLVTTTGCPTPCVALTTIDPDLPAVLSTATVPATFGGVGTEGIKAGGEYVTPDGAFVVWLNPTASASGTPTLGMFNVSTRAAATVPLPAATRAFLGHPRRPEVFLTDAQGPLALSFGGARRLSAPACAGPENSPVSISADGSRVIYSCEFLVGGPHFIVDTNTGALVGTTTVASGAAPALSPDGQALYRLDPGAPWQLRKYAVDGGALLAETPLVSPSPRVVRVDPRTGRIFVIGDTAEVFEGTSLTPVTAGNLPWVDDQVLQQFTWTFDPERPRAYLTSHRLEESGPFQPSVPIISYYVLDTESLLPVIGIRNAATGLGGAKFLVAPRPAAPVGLTANVGGGSVQLTWSSGASNATTLRHVVEAGSGPGLSDRATLTVGPETSLLLNGVPRGTYYVRVRAANVTGSGPASNEVIVTVE